jgi:eukaryotic-like serine/threonine-protein kinase
LDSLNGLAWQKGGSQDPLDLLEAKAYAGRLDADNFGGFSGWRLPTVNELFTILKPAVHGAADCLDGAFDRNQKWLWSADRRSFVAAWYVDVELGFATWGDFSCRCYVRAVCPCRGDASRVLPETPESGP